MASRDRRLALGLAALALLYLAAGRRYPLDTLAAPGPGVFPVAAGAALLLVACSAAAPYANDPAPARGTNGASAAALALLYVCNQNDATVSVIDLTTNKVVRTIDLTTLGFSKNAKPHHVAVEPDGSFWYVTLIGENARSSVRRSRSMRVIRVVTPDGRTVTSSPGRNTPPAT